MYKATQNLLSDNLKVNVKVHFVIYHIDKSMPIPYLRFYLVKDCNEPPENLDDHLSIETYMRENEYLTFPSIDYNAEEHFLFNLYCQGVVESLFHEEREYVQHIQHKGYILEEDANIAYAFFELTPTTTEAEFINRETFIWPVLMDEILHKNVVDTMPIHSFVTTFFMEHPSYIHLTTFVETEQETEKETEPEMKEYLVYEMPVVVYSPVLDYKKTKFTAMFGAIRTDGVFFFYSYNRALDIIKEQPQGKYGLIRTALYTGNTTIDKDEFKENQDINTFYHGYEFQVKNYEQQKPLSYHYVVNYAKPMVIEDK